MRLFVGIDLPKNIKQNILNFQSELRQMGIDGFWKSVDNFHLTLEFLGESDPGGIPKITEVLQKAAGNRKPFILQLGGIGGFPSLKRPHTLWTAVTGNVTELHGLRADIHSGLLHIGFELEERPYSPHMTLASHPKIMCSDFLVSQTKQLGEFNVNDVKLFESVVIRGKRTYPVLAELQLGN